MEFVHLAMLSIVLLGTGNVAHQLFNALENQIVQVYGRNKEALAEFPETVTKTTDPKKILDAQLYVLAVSDLAIKEVSGLLQTRKGLVVHTSGGVTIDVLQTIRKGVFYPLQTFTKGKVLEFSTIPICLEALNEEDYQLLEKLATSISSSVQRVSSEQRKTLHLAAVFANNFSNHMFHIAKEICERDGLDFQLLTPLITETVDKIRLLNPKVAQTGPARRNDIETMQRHLDGLDSAIDKKIYQIVSESIRKSYE